jgi:hypothetical protein
VDKLIVVVADNVDNKSSNVGDLVKYIEYNNCEIINSHIYSVFDLLYHSYSEQLFERMKNRKHVSEFKSENLMNAVVGLKNWLMFMIMLIETEKQITR